MRRISLALALFGAVAAGCGGGAKPSSTAGTQGTAGSTFTVTVNRQGAGTVTSTPAGIDCGPSTSVCAFDFAYGTAVTLSQTSAVYFNGWFGQCGGTGTCALTGNSDKYVVAFFSVNPEAHPNFNDPVLHGAEYFKFVNAQAGALNCKTCHGDQLQGLGLAVSCTQCHATVPAAPVAKDGPHSLAAGHNSGDCARCHSGGGFRDFIGADGTPSAVLTLDYNVGVNKRGTDVDAQASGIDCDACHNTATVLGGGALNKHKFPSGNILTLDGKSAICSQCHDGGRPGYEVSQIAVNVKAVAADTQLPTADNKVVRAHYLPAASTQYGGEAANWYQYAGNIYTARNLHGGVASCVDCHDAHSGALPADAQIAAKCGTCHFDETTGLPVTSYLALEESRQFGFEGDIDGNGSSASVKAEIDGLAAKTYAAIQAYGKEVAGQEICIANNRAYVAVPPAACNVAPNTVEYKKFTPRLVKAVYNYLMYQQDPGAWAHNPRYAVEVLYDTTADLNVALAPLGKNVPNGKRAFNGHFGAAEDASPYAAMIYHGAANAVTGESLPPMGFTSGACYQCHGGTAGLAEFLKAPGAPAWPAATTPATPTPYVAYQVNAMQCSSCHTFNGVSMKGIRNDVANVLFPAQKGATPPASQKVVTVAASAMPAGNAICATCHSGRENGASIDIKIGALTDTSWSLSVTNPHYLGAAGIMMGSTAAVMYQYPAKSYTATPAFWTTGAGSGPHGSPHGGKCASCHAAKGSAHTFEINLATTVAPGIWGGTFPIAGMQPGAANTAACTGCHAGGYALEPKALEFEEASAELYAAIQAYAVANIESIKTATGNTNATGVCYWNAGVGGGAYYALEVSGVCQNGVSPAGSVSFTKANPKLLKAAFNYLWTQKEPGAWAHNEYYVLQAIYDSIEDLGATPSFSVIAVTDPTTHAPVCSPLNRPVTTACP